METFNKKELLQIKKYYLETLKLIETNKKNGSSKRKLESLEDLKKYYEKILYDSNIVFNESFRIKREHNKYITTKLKLVTLSLIIATTSLSGFTSSKKIETKKALNIYNEYLSRIDENEFNNIPSELLKTESYSVLNPYIGMNNEINVDIVKQIESEEEPEITIEPVYEPIIETKTYYTINATEQLQDYINMKAEEYGIPAEIAFTIIERESGGTWETNGVISKTNDYGLSQINICNHSAIYNALGYTTDDLLYNEEKNIDAMFYLLQGIFNQYGYTKDNYSYENVFGTYNGWLNWRNINSSVNYANGCLQILENLKANTYEKEIEQSTVLSLSK